MMMSAQLLLMMFVLMKWPMMKALKMTMKVWQSLFVNWKMKNAGGCFVKN